MGQQSEIIRFKSKNPDLFSGLTGIVDEVNFTIRGVSCITSQCEAEGHSLFVDRTTLTQLHELSADMGQVPVTIDHNGGVDDIDGWLQNFRIDGDKLRADWVLLETHPKTRPMMERARKQPKTFGLSFAFKGDPKGVLYMGKRCARAEAVFSCDVVKRAAANKGGLFSIPEARNVDSSNNQRRSKNIELQNTMPAEPTLQDVLAQLQSMQQTIAQQGEIQQQIVGHINAGVEGEQEGGIDRETLEQLNAASDEELAAQGLTRAEVDAAVGEFNQSLGQQSQEGQESDGQYEGSYGEQGAGEGQMAGVEGGAAGAAAGGGTQFAALQRELVQLKARLNQRDAKEIQFAEKQASEEVRGKIYLIVSQRDQAIQLAEKVVAENEALRVHVRTGTRPVAAGVDEGIRLFSANDNGELHPFQLRVKQIEADKKCSAGQAILFAMKEPNGAAMHADWNRSKTIRA